MTTDCQNITVHALNFDHQGEPVFYASLPCSTDRFKGHRPNGSYDKRRLVSRLWAHLVAMKRPVWKCFHSAHKDACPLHLVHGPLGRPLLLLGESRGPAISFSENGEKVWAALSGDESEIGIDIAGADEFQTGYPFHRVFNAPELQHALSLAGGELGSASALLWSIKEAVVKVLGCAFHLVDPLQLSVYPSVATENGGYTFPVRLSKKALTPFPMDADRDIWVRSFPHGKRWLSISRLKMMNDEERNRHSFLNIHHSK
jgi:phosphopantetheinyl transferase